MEPTRIFELLDRYQQLYHPKDDVLAGKVNGEWVKFNLQTYREMAENISLGLIEMGVKPGDEL